MNGAWGCLTVGLPSVAARPLRRLLPGGHAHGDGDAVAQGLQLHVLATRCNQGDERQRRGAESAVGFGETPAEGTEKSGRVRPRCCFPPLASKKSF